MTKQEIFDSIKGKVIVSCQAVPGEPLYVEEKSIMYLMARAAKRAGTPMIRTSSIRDVVAIKEETGLPVIGLIKINYPGFESFITPTMKEVDELAEVGSDIIALDCTDMKQWGWQEYRRIYDRSEKEISGSDSDGRYLYL